MKYHMGVERSFVWWIAVGEIYPEKNVEKRGKEKLEEKMKNCEKFCLLDWRGEEKLTVEIPRRRF